MKKLFTLLGMSGIIVSHIVQGLIGKTLIRDKLKLRKFYVKTVARHGRWGLKAIKIDLVIEGKENARDRNYLIVANHLSYLDAVILPAFRETTFVTSLEIKATPVLGTLTELGGCLYVNRKSKENIHGEIQEIEEALKQGFNIVIFPEATSTNGEQVKPFKRPLFAAAIKTKTPVLPIVIQYEEIDGEKVTKQNRDKLCWYGDMAFGPHFLQLAAVKKIKIRLKILPEIPANENLTRDILTEQAQNLIQAHYKPIT